MKGIQDIFFSVEINRLNNCKFKNKTKKKLVVTICDICIIA